MATELGLFHNEPIDDDLDEEEKLKYIHDTSSDGPRDRLED